MRGTNIRSNAQLAATLLAFASLILAYVGVQVENGPLRAALILGIVVLATAVGSLIGLGIAHRETLEHAKDDWEKGGPR
jgi:ABC-type multidrug transport system permease subunit